ncbi:uncharacterized protein N7498_002590 [Penicillium cinerascens]|uniref:Uncharacterized protein n=1 Tax=Penicillium cinerascens TaxID=70096 RepID=A0A9W9TB11_9EURO|nr:uncharacterized protein N7498_002590 [Penicillium cinerascens]KAJ5216183.1 hypothetical protein N7498_002590 [Penicillium cinerascens]
MTSFNCTAEVWFNIIVVSLTTAVFLGFPTLLRVYSKHAATSEDRKAINITTPTTPRLFTAQKLHKERSADKEKDKRLQLLEEKAKQYEAHQEKLDKNLKREQEKNEMLRVKLHDKDSRIADLRKQRTRPLTWKEECQMHEDCSLTLHTLRRNHASEMDQVKAKAQDNAKRELYQANFKIELLHKQLAKAELRIEKLTSDNLIIEEELARCKAQIDTSAANYSQDLQLKDKELAEQSSLFANLNQHLEQKTASAAEEATRCDTTIRDLNAEVSTKDDKLKEALAQIEQVRNDQPEELKNALARIVELEKDKSVLLKERYPDKPQPPVVEDTEMVDMEDVEMTDASAANMPARPSNVLAGAAPQAGCRDRQAYKVQLDKQFQVYKVKLENQCKAYKVQLVNEAQAYKVKLDNQFKAHKVQLVNEAQAYKVRLDKERRASRAQLESQALTWKTGEERKLQISINRINRAKDVVDGRNKDLEKKIESMEEATALDQATLRLLQAQQQPIQGQLGQQNQPTQTPTQQSSRPRNQPASQPRGKGVRFNITTNAVTRPAGTFGLGPK